jgi:4-amino-4-deoxy-L-arabinose transferase-like glycosyltransferase
MPSQRKRVGRGKKASEQLPPLTRKPVPTDFSASKARLILVLSTIVLLLPFIEKPFNFDDPLFVWTAKQIAGHPLNPYGFSIVWYVTRTPMYYITQNPPLASYYLAMAGSWLNWSETALHLAFLLPACLAIVATYELASQLTSRPFLAAALTLVAPGFFVSSTSVMCDVPMLALWVTCILAWRQGLHSGKKVSLVLASVLIAVCSLTKYFGICLIPLLLVYSLIRYRRLGSWALYLLLPVGILAAYQVWTQRLYGIGLLSAAAQYAHVKHSTLAASQIGSLLLGLSFTGGALLSLLFIAPKLFPRLWCFGGFLLGTVGAILLGWNITGAFTNAPGSFRVAIQLGACIATGIFTVALAACDGWKHRDADSALLSCWFLGTFIFASFLNWTVNVRSVLPLIPAAAILIARRLDDIGENRTFLSWQIALPVAACAAVSLWLASADYGLASSARQASQLIVQRHAFGPGKVYFSGHWGFQYYMEALGAQPVDVQEHVALQDVLVQPENNSNTFQIPQKDFDLVDSLELDTNVGISTQNSKVDAGFYSSLFGPLPFAIGRVPPEKYSVYHFKQK